MYYVFVGSDGVKTRTIRDAIAVLDSAGVGDLGGLRRDLREDGAWYNDGEGCGVEKQDGRSMRDINEA